LILARANLDLEKKLNFAVFPESQGGPLMHVIAAKAVCFKEAMSEGFKSYQQQVLQNARVMAQGFIDRGYDVISNGTDDHLFLLSLIKQDITGKDADAALGRANITVNKNAVPNDPKPPFVTSGLRIGSPAITTRGFKEAETAELTTWMCDILDDLTNTARIAEVKQLVVDLCRRFPVYKRQLSTDVEAAD
jgi:glycine hydroxymethyltransferase